MFWNYMQNFNSFVGFFFFFSAETLWIGSLKSFSRTHNSTSKWICHFHSCFYLNEWEAAGYLFIVKHFFFFEFHNGEERLYDSSRNWRQDLCLHRDPSECCGSAFKIAAWAIMPMHRSSLFSLIAQAGHMGDDRFSMPAIWGTHLCGGAKSNLFLLLNSSSGGRFLFAPFWFSHRRVPAKISIFDCPWAGNAWLSPLRRERCFFWQWAIPIWSTSSAVCK